jgi:hypothetical protein
MTGVGNARGFAQRRTTWEDNTMIPALDIDPFCTSFFDDPYPAHAAMRDTLRGMAVLPIRMSVA